MRRGTSIALIALFIVIVLAAVVQLRQTGVL